MHPTHISIIGRSKHLFNREVLPQLTLGQGRYRDLVQKIEPGGLIALTKNVKSSDDVEPLIHYLVRLGIPRTDIRVRYPQLSAGDQLASKLSVGLLESGLGFGADVAEHDAGLARYFVTTQSFMAIAQRQRHLVIGPKGSGKSAILRELARECTESLIITPDHYATDVLDALVKSPSGTGLAAYITTWKYTLLVEILRRLVQGNVGEAAALAAIRKYLVDHGHLAGSLSLFERFVAYLHRISQIRGRLGPAEAEVGIEGPGELEKLFKMDEVLALVPALRRVLRRTPFTVFIDELDQSWNNSATANQFLVSLLTAAIQLRGMDPNLHVVVFLRSEIFDLLKPTISQLDKLRSDIESLQWSSRELTKLIVTRAFDSLSINPEGVAAETAVSIMFPGIVVSSGTTTFDYILSRTSYRPREVIQFCNLCLRVACQLDLPGVLPDAVLRAEEEFSTWKFEYIVSENLYIYPRLDMVLERFRGASRRMTSGALDALLTDVILALEMEPAAPTWIRTGMEPRGLLELLYQLEVIGIERLHARVTENRVWEAYDFVFARPKGKPEQSISFLFHPGLWKALELA